MAFQYPPIDTELKGDILCVAETDKGNTIIAIAYVSVPALYIRDFSTCGMYTVDNSVYDFNIDDSTKVIEYKMLNLKGELVEGTDNITKIVKVIDEDLKGEF